MYCCNARHLAMSEFRLYNSLISSSGCDYPRLCLSNAHRIGIMCDVANRIHFRLDDETVYASSPMMFDLLLYPRAFAIDTVKEATCTARIVRNNAEKRIYSNNAFPTIKYLL